ETPDMVIDVAPGLGGCGDPVLLVVGEGDLLAVALAPSGPRGAGEELGRSGIDRQAWRRVRGTEPKLVSGIGANKPVRPVGNRNRHSRLLDRGHGKDRKSVG